MILIEFPVKAPNSLLTFIIIIYTDDDLVIATAIADTKSSGAKHFRANLNSLAKLFQLSKLNFDPEICCDFFHNSQSFE